MPKDRLRLDVVFTFIALIECLVYFISLYISKFHFLFHTPWCLVRVGLVFLSNNFYFSLNNILATVVTEALLPMARSLLYSVTTSIIYLISKLANYSLLCLAFNHNDVSLCNWQDCNALQRHVVSTCYRLLWWHIMIQDD